MVEKNVSGQLLKQKCEDSYRCPSCYMELKSDEIKTHCELEVNRLIEAQELEIDNIKITNGKNEKSRNKIDTCSWGVFQKVKKNRQSRSEARSRKRSSGETKCPICNMKAVRDLNGHIAKCLTSQKMDISHKLGFADDVYGYTEVFDEYEWAGQKRVRVSSLLQGGYASIGVGTNITNGRTEEDEDLNVDDDDTIVYGPSQYSESDIIVPEYVKCDSEKKLHYAGNYICDSSVIKNCSRSQENNNVLTEAKVPNSEKIKNLEQIDLKTAEQVINSLKNKLSQCENNIQNKFKCLICLDEYHNPAISVSCWHVHCEECWLRSLGARKLCPQCNLITSPSDLRRIYM